MHTESSSAVLWETFQPLNFLPFPYLLFFTDVSLFNQQGLPVASDPIPCEDVYISWMVSGLGHSSCQGFRTPLARAGQVLHHRAILRPQQGVVQVSLILTLSTWK